MIKTQKTRARGLAILTALALIFCVGGAALGGGDSLRPYQAKEPSPRRRPTTCARPWAARLRISPGKRATRQKWGDVAFALKPAKLVAANDGVIRAMRARVGDQADAVAAQYGALCYIERQGIWRVSASTASAYNQPENRDIKVGDVLRVRKGSGEETKERDGHGRLRERQGIHSGDERGRF